jgi:hypothetical protein
MKYLRYPLVFLMLVLLAACNSLLDSPNPPDLEVAAHVPPQFKAGNQTCSALLGSDYTEFKIEPVADGTYTSPDGYLTVTIKVNDTSAGQTFDFTSDRTIDAVFAKGGPDGNLYDYRPNGTTADTGLHAPVTSSGKYAGLSHISFCYQLRLDVEKTAKTSVKRTWTWEIDKDGDKTELTLQKNQSYEVNYTVKVSATSEDTDRTVSGTITIANKTGQAATITDVSDTLGSISVPVDCGVTISATQPYTLPDGQTLTCTYSYTNDDKLVLPDTGTNTVTVTTTGTVKGGTATADWNFAIATVT